MNTRLVSLVTLLIVLPLLVVGCASTTTTPSDTLSGVLTPVLDLHDGYVAKANLTDADRALYLGESKRLRATMAGNPTLEDAVVRDTVGAVCDRTRGFIEADNAMPAVDKRVYLRSCALSKALVGAK